MSTANDSSGRSGTSWRSAPAPRKRRRPSDRVWKRQARTPASAEHRLGLGGSRAGQVVFTATALALIGGLLVWVALWFRPIQPVTLALAGSGYELNLALPHNAYGMNGLRGLQELASSAKSRRLEALHSSPVVLTGVSQISDELNRSTTGTTIVFLALHGGSDSRGPFLFIDRERPNTPPTRLYVKELIDHLAELRPRRFVLVLDATQIHSVPGLGLVHNDFAQKLKALESEIEAAANVVVLSSSDTDQLSWVSDRWRTTVFAHYFVEALEGRGKDSADRRTTVEAVWREVKTNVEAWCLANRGAAQTPILLPASPRARSFDLVLDAAPKPKPEEGPIPSRFREDWVEVWRHAHDLEVGIPSPTVETPHLWRRYRDWLIRYDELARADDDACTLIKSTLDSLALKLREGRRLALESTGNSLAMPSAEGLPPADPTRYQAEFNTIWTDPAKLKELIPKLTPEAKRAHAELAYRRAESDASPASLAKAVALLDDLSPRTAPRPAEIHFLAMLVRDAPANPSDPIAFSKLVSRALSVRARAERAALGARVDGPAYSGHVAPWIMPTVRKADESRRKGEDLVFSNDPDGAGWTAAHTHFNEADRLYAQAEADAGKVREVLETVDLALANLPYYGIWASRLPPPTGTAIGPEEGLIPLFARAYELGDKLQPAGPPTPEALEALTAEAKLLATDLAKLEAEFSESVEDRDAGYVRLSAVLTGPLLPTRLREEVIKRLHELSPNLASDNTMPGASELATARAVTASTSRLAARRRASLLLAWLGKRWFDEAMAIPAPSLEDESAGKLSPGLQPYFDVKALIDSDQFSSEAIAQIGYQIGERWRRMPLAIARWLESVHLSEPGAIHPDLARADQLGRRLPGSIGEIERPALTYRQVQLQELLTAQAARTLDDHWFGDDEANPYYRKACGLYLDNVRSLCAEKADRGAAIPLRAASTKVERLEVTGPGPIALTTERRLGVSFGLRIPAGSHVPEGFPVVWLGPLEPGLFEAEASSEGRKSLTVSAPLSASYRARLDLPLTRAVEADPTRFKTPETTKTTVALDGRYRGQKLRWETPVTFHPVPEITSVRFPLPTTGRVAVAADPAVFGRYGEAGGALAIVLDCSGSMAGEVGKAADGTPITKYQEATAALRQVLKRVSRRTEVSLWVFGQDLGSEEDVPAERTIVQKLAPTSWNPDDSAQLDKVMAMVESPALKPFNHSPIIRSMILARDGLQSAQGFKTLLVLTDGKDDRFDQDLEFNRAKKDIPTALRDAFRDSDIEINVVGYKFKGAEADAAQKQFDVISQLPRPGRFFSVTDADQLAATLAQALRPSLKASLESTANIPLEPLTVGQFGDNNRWSKTSPLLGGFELVTQAGQRLQRDLVVNRGDLLLVRLSSPNGGAVQAERGLFSGDAVPRDARERATGWRSSVVRNGRTGEGIELWTTLEKLAVPKESALEMIKPREVWFEGQALGASESPFAQRWSYQTGVPAPCWSLRVPSWPELARPSLQVWWDPDQEATFQSEVVRLADFRSTDEIPARPIKVDGLTILLEMVTVEPRKIEVSPGVYRTEPCLLVRLQYPEGKPYWVRPQGLRTEGAEHRFYKSASKYTGLFWPVTADQADVTLEGLGLISLAEFKARAARRGYTLERPASGKPDPRDTGPGLIPYPGPSLGSPAEPEPVPRAVPPPPPAPPMLTAPADGTGELEPLPMPARGGRG